MMIWLFSTSSSTSSIIPVCSRIGFGMRMPWELPIFITRTLMIYLLDFIGAHIVITTLRNVKKNSGEWLKVKSEKKRVASYAPVKYATLLLSQI
jgi:hypothetical protein